MNDTPRRPCGACRRERPMPNLREITREVDGRNVGAFACDDNPTCVERVQHRVDQANQPREK